MSTGSKEAALRALRETRAAGGRKAASEPVVSAGPVPAKTRAARKSSEPAPPVTKGRGRPAGSPYVGRVPVLIKFDPEAVAWLDEEYVRRKQPSRVDLIRALVDEARR